MTQQEINDEEWHNPENWHGSGLLPIYFSKRDSRVVVGTFYHGRLPPGAINLGHRWGPAALQGGALMGMLTALVAGFLACHFWFA